MAGPIGPASNFEVVMVNFAKQALLFILFFPLFSSATPWPTLPSNISTPGQNATNPSIAVDPNGNVVAVWIESGVVKSNATTVSTNWSSTITTVSNSGASSPVVQIDQNGTATAIWVENGVISTSSMPLNGSWSAEVAIGGTAASSLQMAIDSSGNLVAVWVDGGVIHSATKLFGGSWSATPDTLSGVGSSSPQVAIGNDGTVAVVWQGTVSSSPAIYATTKTIGGTWATPSTISTALVNSCFPKIAVDPNGNAMAIWYSYSLNGYIYSNVAVQASTLPAGGTWSTPVNISAANTSAESIVNPAELSLCIIAGYNDSFATAWTSSYDGAMFNYWSNMYSQGTWSGPISLYQQNNLLANQLNIATDSNSDVFIIWMNYDSDSSSLVVQGALNDMTSYSAIFNNPWSLSVSGNNAFPVVSMNYTSPNLYGASAWVNYDGTNEQIQALTLNHSVIQPPSNLSVSSGVTDYGVLTQNYNVVSWQASPSSNLLTYMIFRDGNYFAWVPSSTLQYTDYNRMTGETGVYGVAATDSYGCQSPMVTIPFTTTGPTGATGP